MTGEIKLTREELEDIRTAAKDEGQYREWMLQSTKRNGIAIVNLEKAIEKLQHPCIVNRTIMGDPECTKTKKEKKLDSFKKTIHFANTVRRYWLHFMTVLGVTLSWVFRVQLLRWISGK